MPRKRSLLAEIEEFLTHHGFTCDRRRYSLVCYKNDWVVEADSREKRIELSWRYESSVDQWDFRKDTEVSSLKIDISYPKELNEVLDNIEVYNINSRGKLITGVGLDLVWRKEFGFDEVDVFKRYIEVLSRYRIKPAVSIVFRVYKEILGEGR